MPTKKEKPIIFSTPMVRAILGRHKTMTRRVIRPQPVLDADGMWTWRDCQWMDGGIGFPASGIADYAPYLPGDVLWVREMFCEYRPEHIIDGKRYAYKANITAESDRVRKRRGFISVIQNENRVNRCGRT